MTGSDHPCGQGPMLATICTKIEDIQRDLQEIKKDQKEYLERCQTADIDRAKYPPPEVVNKEIAKVNRHELYFKIIWVALGCAWAVLLLILSQWIPRILPSP